jgi:aspartate-semialdehyde dehydrogenase
MHTKTQPTRLAIAGASSLRGRELKEMLESGRFSASTIRLVDEEAAAGLLTEVAGEPAVVQPADEESFEGVRLVFFAGSAAFAARHGEAALRGGSTVIDLSGGLEQSPSARLWIPQLTELLAPPAPKNPKELNLFISPAVPAIVSCYLSVALAKLSVQRLAVVFFHPVSEQGLRGIEELESQSVKLLSLQPITQDFFDTQVAFNLLAGYGASSSENLSAVGEQIVFEVTAYLKNRAPVPAIQVIHAPVFHSYTFSVYAEFEKALSAASVAEALRSAGLNVAEKSDEEKTAISNISVAGDDKISIAPPVRDANHPNAYWLWGAADNLRLSAANAVHIAEKLL